MKKIISTLFALLILLNANAEQSDWKEETSKDGSVKVKSKIETKVHNGDERKIVSYIAEVNTSVSLDLALQYLMNSNNYKDFLENTKESREIQKVSDSEWITYLYFNAPWPMPDSDCVQRFKLVKKDENTLVISGTTELDAYDIQDVRRMKFYDIQYKFKKISNNKTKLTLKASFVPVGSIPNWMLKSWLPEGPAGIVTRLLKHIE